MADLEPEYNPDNFVYLDPGTAIDSYFEGALRDNGIRYFKYEKQNLRGKSRLEWKDYYYFSDQDFDKAKSLYGDLVKNLNISEKDNNILSARDEVNNAEIKFFANTYVRLTLLALLIIFLYFWFNGYKR
jgi:hypothetical protein